MFSGNHTEILRRLLFKDEVILASYKLKAALLLLLLLPQKRAAGGEASVLTFTQISPLRAVLFSHRAGSVSKADATQ